MALTMREDLEAAIETMDDTDENNDSGNDSSNVADNDPISDAGAEPDLAASEGEPAEAADENPFDGAPSDLDAPEKPLPTDGADSSTEPKAVKAPVGWNAQERESWGELPDNVKGKIHAREKEMTEAMSNTAAARRTHDHLGQLANSYAPIMAAEGVSDPMQAVEGLFKTVATMRMGSPQQKAQQIAQLIGVYDVDISMLDNMLVGEPTQDPQQSQLEQMLEQKMAPMNQFMNTMQQNAQNANQNREAGIDTEIAQFGQNNEFLDDVRNDMADLMDMAAARGQNMTLDQAYAKACAINPEVSAVMAQRGHNNGLNTNRNNTNRKLNAASSISGRKNGGGVPNTDLSMRETMMAAWDGDLT